METAHAAPSGVIRESEQVVKFEISAAERRLILSSLGSFVAVSFPGAAALFDRLVDEWPHGNSVPVPLESQPPTAKQDPATPNLMPRSEPQRTPQTVEQVRMSTGKYDREAVEQITLTPSKIERKDGQNGPYLSVMWPVRGRGYSSAACFDEVLFPWVAARIKQESTFYVVRAGKYTNIVGVKA